MDNRLSVKFETAQFEQTYKFRTGMGVEQMADVEAFVDPAFLTAVEQNFEAMAKAQFDRLNTFVKEDDDLIEII